MEEGRLGFFQIDPRTWVAQLCEWDDMEGIEGVDGWTVLEAEVDAQHRTSYSCRPCPDFMRDKRCVHTKLLRDDDEYPFRAFSLTDNTESVLFHRGRSGKDENTLSLFLCSSNRGKTVVSHFGRTSSTGQWVCRKHKNGCEHISAAKTNAVFLHLTAHANEAGSEGARAEGEDVDEPEPKARIPVRLHENSVSHLPVAPPRWARLARDDLTSHALVDPIPSRFGIGDTPRCACGGAPKPDTPVEDKTCTLYTTRRAYRSVIEVRRCDSCRRYCGPDLRELGIFNFSNTRLYSHELLNSFTSSMSNFEAPFHAFRKHVANSYEENASPLPFISDTTWRAVWFSFLRIQRLINSFACSKCGDCPEVLIFDGITAGFAVEHCTASLRPPTAREEADGPVRANVRPPAEKLTLVTGKLRVAAQNAVRWRMKVGAGNKSQLPVQGRDGGGDIFETLLVDEDVDGKGAKKRAQTRRAELDKKDAAMQKSLPGIATELKAVHSGLASLFERHVLSRWDKNGEPETALYLALLEQLLAYESVLQFAPRDSWASLQLVADSGHERSVQALLRTVPALGRVLRQELQVMGEISNELKDVAAFVVQRATRGLASLAANDPDSAAVDQAEEDWRKTGTFYGRPRIRARPAYPHLPTDAKQERSTVSDAGGSIGCSKYYEAYGQKGITGGLMAVWCTHSICLGFHVIPKGEGRNDVFSALFTHWQRAPKYVIYDFACALAPYCMLREAEFFKNTIFLIDEFHAGGHTRCSRACFISNYREFDSKLHTVNSSAAECGNAGLQRIRKTLSYLTQEHAIVFGYVFLAMWNRAREAKAEVRENNAKKRSKQRHSNDEPPERRKRRKIREEAP